MGLRDFNTFSLGDLQMKLWLLRPVKGLPDNDNPWDPWYDKPFGYVVRAKTEGEARKIAEDKSGTALKKHTWLNPQYSTCVELTSDGLSEVIIEDFAAA